eukprot:CAMPEP_0197622544 /NCGR_PEP_ID=MMETSP1338-20131121/2808_1 /TAXON_ID=43686 ORGANISM="Pelagodinium beii, Strain RCC1491" /NCGR_SAMPLE_ID=MMETSP1338 /ASSEMBLY_ACC=CAM_ASM_000754 /LENGTH=1119 /DNA_ID=CAMNT_0043192285 /DNA_START=159 /DNA_END=3518 /DNA_ORIENTATION=+
MAIMAGLLVTIIGSSMIIAREGAGVFGSSANNDLNDIRTREHEAYSQVKDWIKVLNQKGEEEEELDEDACVVQRWGSEPRPCDKNQYPNLTQSGDMVMTLFVAKEGDNLFTESQIKQLKAVEDGILKHEEFNDYCLRWDKTGYDTSCSPPLSPLSLFYADFGGSGSMAEVFDDVDAIDGTVDGVLAAFETPGMNAELASIQGSYTTMMMGFMAGANSSCGLGGVGSPMAFYMPGTQACLMQQTMASLTVASTTKLVYEAMFPLVAAMRNPRGEALQDIDKTLLLAAYMKTIGFYAPYVDYYFDSGFSVSNPVSKHSRGIISFGMPLPGYKNSDENRTEQRDKFSAWFREEFNDFLQETQKSGDVDALFFATPLVRDEFLAILLSDAMKVAVSLGLVFAWIWLQTNSVVVAIAGIAEIVLSIPLAFFFYYTIFGFKYFDGLNVMTIFIVAAIGADDIFVFMDQYKMSSYRPEICVDLKTRMNWVYARASWAMFITSATTCAAFICTAASPLPQIQSFGIFSAFVIAADYILVVTWFPAVLCVYHNYLEQRPCCPCCCCGAGTDSGACKFGWRMQELWPCTREHQTSTEIVGARGPGEEPQKRMLEKAISGPFAKFLGSRYGAPGTLAAFFVLLIPAAVLASQIQPLTRSEESLPADHPFQRLWTLSGEEFGSSAQTTNTPVHLVWGVGPIDNDGINILRQGGEAKGALVWDDTFQFDEAAQQHIWNVCEEVRKMEAPNLENFLSRDKDSPESYGEVKCPLDDWKAWLERVGGPGFPLPLAQLKDEMTAFMNSNTTNAYGQDVPLKDVIALGYDQDTNAVRSIIVTVTSQLQSRASHSSEKLSKAYNAFEDWISELNDESGRLGAPTTANKVFQVSDGDFNGPNWVWMHTQGLFRESAITGACVGTVLAFIVILCATQQIIIACSAFITIASILVTVIAMMKIANYELGSTTSICITILAGLSVDYVVHLAHAYNDSEADGRAEKFQEAFDVIGVSVLSGMITSLLASLVLLMCQLQFFAIFGFFMIFTVTWAWLWGNMFFMCLMRLCGPDKSMPWYLQVPYSVLPPAPKCCQSTPVKVEDEVAEAKEEVVIDRVNAPSPDPVEGQPLEVPRSPGSLPAHS